MFWVLGMLALAAGSLGAVCFHLRDQHIGFRPELTRAMWWFLAVFLIALVGMVLDLTFGWTP